MSRRLRLGGLAISGVVALALAALLRQQFQ